MSYLDEIRGASGISYEDVAGGNDDNPIDYESERRLAEEMWKQRKMIADLTPGQIEVARANLYDLFWDESRRFNTENISADAGGKRVLLVKYFPHKFGANKEQDVYASDSAVVGSLFKQVVRTAKREVERNSPDSFFARKK